MFLWFAQSIFTKAIDLPQLRKKERGFTLLNTKDL